ncbi:MAG: Fic family protein [Bacteroidia bacterium]
MMKPTQAYNKLPLLPPKISFSGNVYKKTIEANKALAELKGLAQLIPDQAIILNSLVLREAKDSSGIENIVTTQDELYKAYSVDNTPADPNVKEVLNYREALWTGFEVIRKKGLITIRDITKIQEVLIGNNAGIRKQPGTALKNTRTGEVIYTPPTGKEVILEKMKNLENYINRGDDIDPLIKMAVIHYQFESIHPFYDGNGRAGRIINVLYLILNGLLELPVLYLSSYIINHKKQYYEGLTKVRLKNDWESWIIYMLDSVEQTSRSTIKLVKGIKQLMDKEVQNVRMKQPRIYSKELVESLFHHPYCRISTLEKSLKITRFTASKYLKDLEKIGLLKGEKAGRDMLYINKPLMALLKEQDQLLK